MKHIGISAADVLMGEPDDAREMTGMAGTMRIVVDQRGITVVWLALAVAAVGLALAIGLANGPGSEVPVPDIMPDRAAIEIERFAVTHGVTPAAPAARPECARSTVPDERDTVRRGVYPTGLAAIEACGLRTANARELDAIRRAPIASADDSSWLIDWQNFHARR